LHHSERVSYTLSDLFIVLFLFLLLVLFYRQPSDSYAFDGGSYGKEEEPITTGDNMLFAPAAPADVKKKKKRIKNGIVTPKSKSSSRKRHADVSPSPSQDTPTKSPPADRPGTPPPIPPKHLMVDDEEEDIWYAKWWIACFPDTFKNLMPKR
jgi:hypothetical protein